VTYPGRGLAVLNQPPITVTAIGVMASA
jgi:hypothetical protein